MRIIEFRIIMPVDFERTQAGTIYTCARRMNQETHDNEGFVELESRSIEDEGHPGFYVHRQMHFKSRIPGAVRWMVPERYGIIDEFNVNAFPNYKDEYRVGGMGKDMVCIVTTRHAPLESIESIPDNLTGLTDEEKAIREIVYLDILDGRESKNAEFDLHGFSFPEGGITGFPAKSAKSSPKEIPKWCHGFEGPKVLIVKCLKFHFKWFGFQTIIEKVVSTSVLPEVFMDTHRAMIKWLPEWYNMTVEEARAYERGKAEQTNQNMQVEIVNNE